MKLLPLLILVMLQMGFTQQDKGWGTCKGYSKNKYNKVEMDCMDEFGTLWYMRNEWSLSKLDNPESIRRWYDYDGKDSVVATVKGDCSSKCTISWNSYELVFKDRLVAKKTIRFYGGAYLVFIPGKAKTNCEDGFLYTSQEFYASGSLHIERGEQNSKCITVKKEYFEDGRLAGTSTYKNVELVGYKKCTDGRQGNESLDCTRHLVKR